jgi:hypothetical protein
MRRSAAISLLLLIVIAAPMSAGASHKPGHGPPAGDSLTVAAKPNPIVYGASVSIGGKLTSADNAGKSVIVESDPFPYDVFSNAGNATTTASGQYSFSDDPGLNTRYRARQGNLLSPVVTVLVRIRLGLRVSDRTPDRGERVRFHGRACPEHVGALVRIQRRGAGGWATVARTRTVDATRCATFSRRVRVFSDGRYRAVVAGDADHARGISPTRFLDVD